MRIWHLKVISKTPNYRVFCIYGYSQFRLFVFPSPGPRPQFVFTGPGIQFIVLQLKCVIALQHLLTCTSFILLIWVWELSVYCKIKKATELFMPKYLYCVMIIIWVFATYFFHATGLWTVWSGILNYYVVFRAHLLKR